MRRLPEHPRLKLPLDRQELGRATHDAELVKICRRRVGGRDEVPVDRRILKQGINALERNEIDAKRRETVLQRNLERCETLVIEGGGPKDDADVEIRTGGTDTPALEQRQALIGAGAEEIEGQHIVCGGDQVELSIRDGHEASLPQPRILRSSCNQEAPSPISPRLIG